MKRPFGVTFCGFLAFCEAAGIVLSILFHGSFLGRSLRQSGALFELAAAGAALLFLIAGFGLMELRAGARVLAQYLAALYMLVTVAALWSGARGFTPLGARYFYGENVAACTISLWATWYLSTASVRAGFERNWANLLEQR